MIYKASITKRNLEKETRLRNSNFLKAGYLILLTIKNARLYTIATINPGCTLDPNSPSKAIIIEAITAAAAGVGSPIKCCP